MSTLIRNMIIRLWSGSFPIAGLLLLLFTACSKEDASTPVVSLQAIPATDTLRGIIGENTLLTNNRTWYIDGWVYIANEAVLSIEPGTLLKVLRNDQKNVDGGLIVTRGAKIVAPGTAYAPITLTCSDTLHTCNSVKMGVVLLGKSPVKVPLSIIKGFAGLNGSLAYGGKLPDDSSGVLHHVQIIYPYTRHRGIAGQDSLRAGLFLMGTGDRTVIKNVIGRQVTPDIQIKLR
ncbi:hypothetical protein L3C95_22475 [Chitinophaga filiformis]|uniref:hypothetical protein n=1 Tax=Chitinophaga filiformis TaxID=104663 RepID=UPI001F17982F|nr:hypothetical protein [Chitinophaga filiformis]MCF6405687.1 hypothetical protein [Chitinophaga filiformis]